jgi:hypothetical protein
MRRGRKGSRTVTGSAARTAWLTSPSTALRADSRRRCPHAVYFCGLSKSSESSFAFQAKVWARSKLAAARADFDWSTNWRIWETESCSAALNWRLAIFLRLSSVAASILLAASFFWVASPPTEPPANWMLCSVIPPCFTITFGGGQFLGASGVEDACAPPGCGEVVAEFDPEAVEVAGGESQGAAGATFFLGPVFFAVLALGLLADAGLAGGWAEEGFVVSGSA